MNRSTRPCRTFSSPALLLSLFSLFLAACGPGGATDDESCQDGSQRECYDGPPGTYGVGQCEAGIQTCTEGKWGGCVGQVLPEDELCDGIDNNCNGEIDEGVENSCGGCVELPTYVGAPCDGCGTMECAGLDDLFCQLPKIPIGGECVAENGCAGVMKCSDGQEAVCVTEETVNECGVCNGPSVGGLGESCETDGCSGVLVCNEDGDAAVCSATGPNNCETCNAPDVEGVDDECVAANGCVGVGVCDGSEESGMRCEAPQRNACGSCGGPTIHVQIGSTCKIGDCEGSWECSSDGQGVVCDAPGINQCDQCGPPLPIGESCETPEGCEGVYELAACGATPESNTLVCNAPAKNQCGLCGGPAISGLGASCTIEENGCPGEFECAEDQESLVCNAPSRNACGGCEPLDAVEGESCTNEDGCEGTWACSGLNTLFCDAFELNSCGACASEVPDLGGNCPVDGNHCGGQYICSEEGDDRICEPRAVNECGVCEGDPLPDFGMGCFTETGCPSTLACNNDGTGLKCEAVAPGACNRVEHVLISEFSPEGRVSYLPGEATAGQRARDEFIELYNPSDEAIDLDGYMLWSRPNAISPHINAFQLVFHFDSSVHNTVIAARSYLLWGGATYLGNQPPANFFEPSDNGRDLLPSPASGTGGQVWLLRPAEPAEPSPVTKDSKPPVDMQLSHAQVVDMVAWQGPDPVDPSSIGDLNVVLYQGSGPVPEWGELGGSYERKAFVSSTQSSMAPGGNDASLGNGHHSGDNASDWLFRTTRQAQNRASPPEPATFPSHPEP